MAKGGKEYGPFIAVKPVSRLAGALTPAGEWNSSAIPTAIDDPLNVEAISLTLRLRTLSFSMRSRDQILPLLH